jgi:hypothetical protein
MIYLAAFTLVCPVLMWLLFYFLYNKLKGDTTRYQAVWVVGVVVDLYMNLIWGTLVFIQLPNINRGFLSARMDDLIRIDRGWRQKLAIYLVGRFLEPYDLSNPKQHKTYGEYQA